ncbi:MAG: class C sortase [Clostridiales bacterium]|nr:class C sortase [Clostridiales bacterium]
MKNNKIITPLLMLCMLIGIGLLLYPSLSSYINEKNSTKAVASYHEQVEELADNRVDRLFQDALLYNEALLEKGITLAPGEEQLSRYHRTLNINADGMMASIEIPSIHVNLPIYHGTSDEVLQTAVGHMEWSALPVGGSGSHCVVSGHRGLPSAKLFTDLDRMVVGDVFYIHTLNRTLIYEVEEIAIVEPKDTSLLMPISGRDLCTLVTCTPYSVNSHRLLIRGHRIEEEARGNDVYVMTDGFLMDPLLLTPIIAVPLYLLLMLGVLLRKPKRKG